MQYPRSSSPEQTAARAYYESLWKEDEVLPAYGEHCKAARCEEDVWNPAPSYHTALNSEMISLADQLDLWFASLAKRIRYFTG